jgi:hypothetical protein
MVREARAKSAADKACGRAPPRPPAEIRQGVDDGDADAMQAAGGLVGLGVELSAGVQRRHDDFERRLVLELRMRIDRDAAAVVGDGEVSRRRPARHLDEGGVAGHRLVHRIVDDLGEQVMQRVLVGAADIHAGTHGAPAPAPPAPRWRRRYSRPRPACPWRAPASARPWAPVSPPATCARRRRRKGRCWPWPDSRSPHRIDLRSYATIGGRNGTERKRPSRPD